MIQICDLGLSILMGDIGVQSGCTIPDNFGTKGASQRLQLRGV